MVCSWQGVCKHDNPLYHIQFSHSTHKTAPTRLFLLTKLKSQIGVVHYPVRDKQSQEVLATLFANNMWFKSLPSECTDTIIDICLQKFSSKIRWANLNQTQNCLITLATQPFPCSLTINSPLLLNHALRTPPSSAAKVSKPHSPCVAVSFENSTSLQLVSELVSQRAAGGGQLFY